MRTDLAAPMSMTPRGQRSPINVRRSKLFSQAHVLFRLGAGLTVLAALALGSPHGRAEHECEAEYRALPPTAGNGERP
jgi:hypothetical protein